MGVSTSALASCSGVTKITLSMGGERYGVTDST